MSDFAQKLTLSVVAVAVGLGLVLFGWFVTRQLVWSAAGLFFAAIGVAAFTLTFAPKAPGRWGAFLRSPGVSVLLLAAVGASLCYTLMVAVFFK